MLVLYQHCADDISILCRTNIKIVKKINKNNRLKLKYDNAKNKIVKKQKKKTILFFLFIITKIILVFYYLIIF